MNLTRGERIELWRRRQRATQQDVADVLGVSVARVRKWEADRAAPGAPLFEVGALAPFERCWLARRRSGLALRELSEELGLAVSWLHKAERGELGDIAALVAYWGVE